jgi:type I restriction enzyme M protein
MSHRISQQRLESYLWGAATLLRGTIDAGDYKQFIFPLLFYKRLCDVFEEETQAALKESGGDATFAAYPENHRFQVPPDAHWEKVRHTATGVGPAIQTGMRAIETANPDRLFGIFGDAQWTNKDRLSDAMLRDLVEHFSTLKLTVANLPEDELGNGYEFLIKKFADDSGHTAAEFYTNRTVVHLMTEMLKPEPGESIYDPTCGSGGMLLSCITHLRRQGQEWRNVRLYGQERNLMTSSIARMNCFLHGLEDFRIERGDTLSDPKFVEGDRLKQFDVVLANPPYSIKQWDRETFASDPWGRNLYGTPPQGRADYAFWQHILASLSAKTGRCAILFPHGVLFRQEEAEMRRKLVEADVIECVLGLGPGLFYNSPMEACVVICRTSKPKGRKERILFINAVDEVTRERAQSFLTGYHNKRIVACYNQFSTEAGFSRVAPLEEIRSKGHSLSIASFVEPAANGNGGVPTSRGALTDGLEAWLDSRRNVAEAVTSVAPELNGPDLVYQPKVDAPALVADRVGWTRVRFGDVVENANDTVKPEAAGLDRFIGLEHLEPASLHIRSWGNVSDGTTFTRRCRPGQVLFGKRRAYQRKVASAEFDAVVSGDIYVLGPKNDRLLPELLPFLCLTERFFQHAVATSAGSLSPRTNWSSLASFEFDLPPLDHQRRLAGLAWQLDDAVRLYRKLLDATLVAKQRTIDNELHANASLGTPLRLADVCDLVVDGTHFTPTYLSEGTPFLRVTDIQSTSIDWDRVKRISRTQHDQLCKRCRPQRGDVLLSKNGTIGITKVVDWDDDFSIFVSLCLLRPKPSLLPEYLAEAMRSPFVQEQFKKRSKQATVTNLHLEEIRDCLIPLPDLVRQQALIRMAAECDRATAATQQHLDSLLELQSGFLSALMS